MTNMSVPLIDLSGTVKALMTQVGLSDDTLSQVLAVADSLGELPGGLDSSFVEKEMRLMSAILDGSALNHHLEPFYYHALIESLNQEQNTSSSKSSRI